MKVGVIGAGYWGKKHVEEYRALGHEVHVSDLLEQNLQACQQRYGAVCHADYKQLLADPDIFAVSICTPNHTHHQVALDALKAGKHVLIEKPMVMSVSDADGIIKAAQEAGKHVSVGYLYRYNNAINYAKQQIAQGALGQIYTMHFRWTNLEPVWPDRDIIFDLGAHPVDISLHLLGRLPRAVHANGNAFRQQNEEMAVINYHIGKTLINIEGSWITPIKTRDITIVGSERTLWIDALPQSIKIIDHATRGEDLIKVEQSNTIREELAHFISEARNNPHQEAAKSGRDVIKVLQAARHSVQEKRSAALLSE